MNEERGRNEGRIGGGGREENREPPQSQVYAPSWPQRLTWNLNNFLVGAEESSLRQLAPS